RLQTIGQRENRMETEKTARGFCRGLQHGGFRSDETSLGATESKKSHVEDI
ncbi:hypothetical protein KI387_026350, partial [Taxus chinensis]